MKFRLPRKTKKQLKKGLFLYPADEDGSSLHATPSKSQEEYDLYKKGIIKNLFSRTSKERDEFKKKIFSPIDIAESELIKAVDYIFAKEYRGTSLITLLKAKQHTEAKKHYYAFINAYNLTINGESYGNTCCMAVDSAKEIMKKK